MKTPSIPLSLAVCLILAAVQPLIPAGDPASAIERFISYKAISDVQMSRSGRYVSFVHRELSDKGKELETIHIRDLDGDNHRSIAIPDNNDLRTYTWAGSDDTVYYRIRYKNEGSVAMTYDVTDGSFLKSPIAYRKYAFQEWPRQPGKLIFRERQGDLLHLHHFDRGTEKVEFLVTAPPDTTELFFNQINGWPRIAHSANRRSYDILMSEEKIGTEQLHLLEGPDSSWESLPDFEISVAGYRDLYDGRYPLGLSPDGRLLYFGMRSEHGTLGIYSYDLEKRGDLQEIATNPDYDLFHPSFITYWEDEPIRFSDKRNTILGFQDFSVFKQYVWIDPYFRKIQETVDQALPGKANLFHRWNYDETRFIIASSDDRSYTSYYLLDVTKGSFTLLGNQKPWIKDADCSRELTLRLSLRDGTRALCYLRVPPGVQNPRHLPLIVRMPTSPYTRWWWVNDDLSQLLASQGYAILKIQPRGQPGFGRAYFEEGFDPELRTIRQDIQDIVSALIRKEIADPEKVCLLGEDWGGFYSLLAMADSPYLYQAAVLIDPLTDVAFYFKDGERFRRGAERYNFFQEIRQLAEKSEDPFALDPILDTITSPVLLLTQKEANEPHIHAKSLNSALRKRGVSSEWVKNRSSWHDYDEGRLLKDRQDAADILAFLQAQVPVEQGQPDP